MANPKQCRGRTSRRSLRGASAVLALAVVLAMGAVTTQSAQAQTFTVLYSFTWGSDGAYPYAGLVTDTDGDLYGTTANSGASNYRVVFKLDSGGTETVLHSFTGSSDGGYPYAGLVRDTAGALYGTAAYGGASNYGVVFKVDSGGTETVLYNFTRGTTDGWNPLGGLVRDTLGNLYGTTSGCGSSNYGTVFEVDTGGTETVLHSFTRLDGANPVYAGLLMDQKGNLYGVTSEGGTFSQGVVYKLSKGGTFKVLHSFTGGTTDRVLPLRNSDYGQEHLSLWHYLEMRRLQRGDCVEGEQQRH